MLYQNSFKSFTGYCFLYEVFVLTVLIHTCCADRLIIDAPSSITLDNADAVFSNDISGMITYLMSFSSSWSKFIQGLILLGYLVKFNVIRVAKKPGI